MNVARNNGALSSDPIAAHPGATGLAPSGGKANYPLLGVNPKPPAMRVDSLLCDETQGNRSVPDRVTDQVYVPGVFDTARW